MPKRYTLLTQARSNVQSITRYIAADNPAAARKMKIAIMNACIALGENPYMGQERKDLTHKPVRILRIYHATRHIDAIL